MTIISEMVHVIIANIIVQIVVHNYYIWIVIIISQYQWPIFVAYKLKVCSE